MARLIPATLDPTSSPGEAEIFLELRRDSSTEGWIALHSLDIARHESQVAGEADFVVIVPGLGVLVVEIKSHLSIRRDADGRWFLGEKAKPEIRGPFKQAASAMHSIRDEVQARRPELRRVPFWSAACFPRVHFATRSPEWHEWQVIDKQRLARASFARCVVEVLTSARQHLAQVPNASWFDPSSQSPTPDEAARIAEILRPKFEFFQSPKARLRRLDEDVKKYTEDQFRLLDMLEPNERVLASAPAGTGKTVLALEAARRQAATGKRVLLVCFNTLLGAWLREQMSNTSQVRASTLHSELLRIARINAPSAATGRFWEDELPQSAIDRLLEQSGAAPYDVLVVDEAQDLMRPVYLDCLDLLVDRGLENGRWQFFGDFEKQSIYGVPFTAIEDLTKQRLGTSARCRLRTNCRNTPRIAERVYFLGGLAPHYDHVLRPDDEVEPRIRYYTTAAEQQRLLSDELDDLLSAGFSASSIVVLAPVTNSCARNLSADGRWKGFLCPFASLTKNAIKYTTIQSFKGLEASAVVLTDIEAIETAEARSLLYVGTSRALHRLAVIANRRVRDSVRSALVLSATA